MHATKPTSGFSVTENAAEALISDDERLACRELNMREKVCSSDFIIRLIA